MRQPLIYSLLLHFVVFAVAYIGVPVPDPDMLSMETPVAVDIVTVAERTNAPAASVKPKLVAKSMPEPAAERTPPPQPPAKPEARPSEPAPQSEVAKFVPARAKPAPVVRPKKPEKPALKPKPPPKPAKTEPKVQPEKEQSSTSAFESVLKTVEQLKAQPPETDEQPDKKQSEAALESQVTKALGKSPEPYDEGLPVTMSEIDAVRRQIERCWNLPAGAKDAENLTVAIKVEMNIDGTPRTALVTDQGRMRDDPFYRAAAESAVRAVLNPRCHPFTLPREKFARWKTMTLVFNPKEMFGT